MWQKLSKTALLGTDRAALPSQLVEQLQTYGLKSNLGAAEQVLEATAILATMRKAGFQPKDADNLALSATAEAEERKPCSTKSMRHLNLILNQSFSDCLPEFLLHLKNNYKTLPPEKLPELLDACRSSKDLWVQLRPVIGKRGEWLINLNSHWEKLRLKPDVRNWDIAPRDERVAILQYLRETDPQTAIELLELSWKEEEPRTKALFIETLKTGLTSKDERFLEVCLDDKRKEVRQQAAKLLIHLPKSAYMQRMFDRAVDCMSLKKNPVKKEKLELDFPTDLDKAAKRDGIQTADPKWKGGNFQTGQFFQIFSLIPLEKWEQHFDRTTKELLESFVRSDWSIMLLEAVVHSSTLHESDDWMRVLMDFWIDNHHRSRWAKTDVKPVIEALPDEVYNAIGFKLLKQDNIDFLNGNDFALHFFRSPHQQWDDKLTLHFIKHFRDWLLSEHGSYWGGGHFKAILKNIAYRCNPALHSRLNNAFPEGSRFWSAWEKDVRSFLTIVSFRKEMIGELSSE